MFLAKNSPAKNVPGEELVKNLPSKEFCGEDLSSEVLSGGDSF
jgi:hypothetical protein